MSGYVSTKTGEWVLDDSLDMQGLSGQSDRQDDSASIIDDASGALVNPATGGLLLPANSGGLIIVGDSITMYGDQPRKSIAALQFHASMTLVEFSPDTPTGVATLTYSASTKSATFAEFGGSAGASVTLVPGFNVITSAGGHQILLGVRYDLLPTSNIVFSLTVASTTNAGTSSRGAAAWACAQAGQRISIAANHGIGGDRISDVLARITQVVSGDKYGVPYKEKPRAALLLIGTNTVLSTVLTVDDMMEDYEAICDALLLAKIEPICCTLTARSASGYGNATPMSADQTATFHEFNRRVRLAAMERGLDVVDYLSWTRDPDNAYLMPVSGYTADYLHPTPLGAFAMSKALLPVLTRKFVSKPRAFLGAGDTENKWVNPAFLGTGGTAGTGVTSAVVPDSYTAARISGTGTTCTLTRVTATDGGLAWVQMACTGATSDSDVSLTATSAVTAADYGLVPGVKFYAEVEVEVDAGSSNLYCADLRVAITNAAGTYRKSAMVRDAGSSRYWPTEAISMIIRSPIITIPSDVTSTGIEISPVVSLATGGAATVRFRDLQVVIVA